MGLNKHEKNFRGIYMTGIIGYGAYIPKYRIKVEDIAEIWDENPEKIKGGLKVNQKSVPGPNEDTATIAVEAARNALNRSGTSGEDIGAIYVGSESHPYAVKPTSSIVGESIHASPDMTAADLEFACKAGTAGIQMCMGMVKSGMIKHGMSIGADTAQSKPGDALEYSAAAGGAAFLIGNDDLIAEINETCSYTTDTPDFWRKEGEEYPEHGGRFTGKPGYYKHVISSTKKLMELCDTTPEDYDYVVLHQPNGKFPSRAAKKLGISKEKIKDGLLVKSIGNTYSGSTMLGLASVLDKADPQDRILVTSYGSGAGSDSFDMSVTERIEEIRDKAPLVESFMKNLEYLSYGKYVKIRKKLAR